MSSISRRRVLGLGLVGGVVTVAGTGAARADNLVTDKAEVPPEVRSAFGNPTLQGQGRLRFLGLRVYDALLWTPAGQRVTAADAGIQPLALEIRYQRTLQGQQIAERSLLEMKRQGELEEVVALRWLQSMKGLFPDVAEGSRITGLNLPREGARFFVDGRLKGTVAEPEFARRFFGIWLSPQSSDQRLRLSLLGSGPATP
jgi:hypothetical protein